MASYTNSSVKIQHYIVAPEGPFKDRVRSENSIRKLACYSFKFTKKTTLKANLSLTHVHDFTKFPENTVTTAVKGMGPAGVGTSLDELCFGYCQEPPCVNSSLCQLVLS